MEIQTTVGATNNSKGSKPNLRSDRTGSLVVTQGGMQHEETVLNGNVYTGSNLGGTPVTSQAGLSATTPVLTLYNPSTSGINVVLTTITVAITSSPAAACSIMLAYNSSTAAAPTSTTVANVTNALLGTGKQPIAQCYRIATLAAAPLATRFIGGTAGASSIDCYSFIDHIDGEVIIGPGVAVSIQTTSAASLLASFTWEEEEI